MPADIETTAVGITGTRQQAMQRLKIGVGGLVAMLLLVATASAIMQQARLAEDPASEGEQAAAEQKPSSDPLVDMGVAPELPSEEVVVPDLPAEQVPRIEPPADGEEGIDPID